MCTIEEVKRCKVEVIISEVHVTPGFLLAFDRFITREITETQKILQTEAILIDGRLLKTSVPKYKHKIALLI